jgi:hypothetical protein
VQKLQKKFQKGIEKEIRIKNDLEILTEFDFH